MMVGIRRIQGKLKIFVEAGGGRGKRYGAKDAKVRNEDG